MFIKGIPSGDGECWCLLVTRETFEALTGGPPDDEFDKMKVKTDKAYCYKVYPCTLFDISFEKKHIYLFSIEAQPFSELT